MAEEINGRNGHVYVVSAARTPIGKFGGRSRRRRRSSWAASRSAPRSSGPACPTGTPIDEVLMGQVLQAGVGQAPARQAALRAGLPDGDARDDDQPRLRLGPQVDHARRRGDPGGRRRGRRRGRHGVDEPGAVPAPGARGSGYRLGQRRARRRDRPDGLWCTVEDCHMGTHAERVAIKDGVSREDQDAFALASPPAGDRGDRRRPVRRRAGAGHRPRREGPRDRRRPSTRARAATPRSRRSPD